MSSDLKETQPVNDTEYAVKADHLSKIFVLKDAERKYRRGRQFYALKDLSFSVPKGEVVGVLGTNGSGKSTLTLLLAGISVGDEGTLEVNGEQALVAINTGLNDQLTGLENIRVKGALLGLRRKEIEQIEQTVQDFSELGDFLYQPVKKYSSGMKSRLGFSITLALDPDILIVDEALSVGDKTFAAKCMKHMLSLRDQQNKTIFFVSHSLQQIREFCTSAIWIEGGMLRESGEVEEVCTHYAAYSSELSHMKKDDLEAHLAAKFQARLVAA